VWDEDSKDYIWDNNDPEIVVDDGGAAATTIDHTQHTSWNALSASSDEVDPEIQVAALLVVAGFWGTGLTVAYKDQIAAKIKKCFARRGEEWTVGRSTSGEAIQLAIRKRDDGTKHEGVSLFLNRNIDRFLVASANREKVYYFDFDRITSIAWGLGMRDGLFYEAEHAQVWMVELAKRVLEAGPAASTSRIRKLMKDVYEEVEAEHGPFEDTKPGGHWLTHKKREVCQHIVVPDAPFLA
jgi:hypothetical protein